MFGKTFGRRRVSQSTLPAHPGPDADGVARVIPKEIFDGPTGAFLREIGFSPDDASNLMPTQHSVQAKANALEAEREDFVAGVNRALPAGCMVIPWALIPYRVWQGERAGFLMLTCDLYPASLFNTMLLPADAASAHTLGLPEHPRGPVDGIDDAAVRFLGELQAEYQASHQASPAPLPPATCRRSRAANRNAGRSPAMSWA